jgi:hypothetical protein
MNLNVYSSNFSLKTEYIDGSIRNGSQCTEEQLKEGFKLFDLDHNGILDYKVKTQSLLKLLLKKIINCFLNCKEFYCAMNYLTAINKK